MAEHPVPRGLRGHAALAEPARWSESAKPVHERRQRFGFVEHAEGPYYYTVNGVRLHEFRRQQQLRAGRRIRLLDRDALLPAAARRGSRAARKRGGATSGSASTRCGFPPRVPTRYMLETADEAGYMLMPEGGSWGNGTCAVPRRALLAATAGH